MSIRVMDFAATAGSGQALRLVCLQDEAGTFACWRKPKVFLESIDRATTDLVVLAER